MTVRVDVHANMDTLDPRKLEQQRLAALARYRIVDTAAEAMYDDITLLAAEICEVPIALISLVERDRQWFKSVVGLEIEETNLAVSFCKHGLNGPETMVINDARQDERFHDNPLVTGDPNIRFYAGAPLRTSDGFNLGSLCVIDREPRQLDARKQRALEALARQVMTQLELRLKAIEIESASAALRQAEKLAAVGRLASSISHEINNPLQAVTNLLFMADFDLPFDKHVLLTQAQTELTRVTQVVTQALRFHRQSENPIRVRIGDIVEESLSLFRQRFTHAGVRLEVRDRSRESLLCSAGDVRQAVSNFISNALDATRAGGALTVHIYDAADGIRLTIADTGIGMSAETEQRLFEPFYSTKGITGNGLGLWVAKEVLDKHGAHIQMRSSQQVGKSGSIFRITFPRVSLLHDATTI